MAFWDFLTWLFDKILSVGEHVPIAVTKVYQYPHPDALPTATQIAIQAVQAPLAVTSPLAQKGILLLYGAAGVIFALIFGALCAIATYGLIILPASIIWNLVKEYRFANKKQ
jgi:hypothetical protein